MTMQPAAAAFGANSAEMLPPAENKAICAFEKSNSARSRTTTSLPLKRILLPAERLLAMAPVLTQAKTPLVIANAGTAWITTLSPYIARLSFSMWHTGYPMGGYAAKSIGCKTAAVAYTDFPTGKVSVEAFTTSNAP